MMGSSKPHILDKLVGPYKLIIYTNSNKQLTLTEKLKVYRCYRQHLPRVCSCPQSVLALLDDLLPPVCAAPFFVWHAGRKGWGVQSLLTSAAAQPVTNKTLFTLSLPQFLLCGCVCVCVGVCAHVCVCACVCVCV